MTPALINKAQRMYDSKQFTMAEIAASCAVAPMTIYRSIRTDSARTPTPSPQAADLAVTALVPDPPPLIRVGFYTRVGDDGEAV
jgi:hypothetical protein